VTLQNSVGPRTDFADFQHAKKYRGEGETFRDAMGRVAGALQDSPEHYQTFRDILLGQRFMPAGRVQSAIGSTKNVTAYNCFVSGTIEDSFVEGNGSIMDRAKEAATTMRMGGGIGYDFSTLRPRGELIKKLKSRATGPISFMRIFNEVGLCTSSTDHRRGAQMGVLRVDHPDIREFIHAKQKDGVLTGFNMSIGVTDEFMRALKADDDSFDLRWGGRVYDTVSARNLWDEVMRCTWDWAEPGVLFIDIINDDNNLRHCETIVATNPCGEQPLPPYGACLLGSFNLVKYLIQGSREHLNLQTASGPGWAFDYEAFAEDVAPVVRAMDNVVDRTTYPLYEQEKEAKAKRRMGLGVTGLANAIEALGHPYGTPGFIFVQQEVLRILRDEAYRASALLAKEKGPFPLWNLLAFRETPMWARLPDDIQMLIIQHGLRNSHLTSIAPTGTISLTADNISSGCEPVYAYSVRRTYQTFEGPKETMLEDYGYRFLGVKGRRTRDCSVNDHLAVLKACVPYIDSAISKTVNVEGTVTWEEFKQVYVSMWEARVKGGTTFRKDGKRFGIMSDEDDAGDTAGVLELTPDMEAQGSACYIDPHTGARSCGE
jgi:ribonucleoside-diphosphate reductase alpha chain